MDVSSWLGLGLGAVIGAVAGLWQARDMRCTAAAGPRLATTLSAAVRLVTVVTALLAAWRLAGANQFWLAGGVAVAYGGVFAVALKRTLAKKQ
jgi:hypothetical protein